MKLHTILKEDGVNKLDMLAHQAQAAFDDGEVLNCRSLLTRYEAARAAGEIPGIPGLDDMIEEIKADLIKLNDVQDDNIDDGVFVGLDARALDDLDSSNDMIQYGRRNNIKPYSDEYVDPDSLYDFGAITIVYSENGKLFAQEFPTTHTDVVELSSVTDKLFAGTRYEGQSRDSWDHSNYYMNAQRCALMGRVNNKGTKLSFWNTDASLVDALLAPCIAEMLSRRMIGPDTKVMAPTLESPVLAADIRSVRIRELSPEEQERIELQQQLHLAVGARKDAIRKKLGMKKPTSKKHPMAVALQNAGHATPGQKWWAGTSEDLGRKLSRILQ